MTRRKAPALDLPETLEEAAVLASRVALLEADIAGIEAEQKVRLALVNQEIGERIATRRDELDALIPRLSAWWQASGRELLANGKKSAKFAGVEMGMRTDPPSLGWVKGNTAKKLLAALLGLPWALNAKLLRVTYALDKDAILKAVSKPGDIADKLTRLGFKRVQDEKFFIEPVPPKDGDA